MNNGTEQTNYMNLNSSRLSSLHIKDPVSNKLYTELKNEMYQREQE